MENTLPVIQAQIENSLELGWEPEDIILVSNYDLSLEKIYPLKIELNKHCLTGSKMYALWWVMNQPWYKEETIWAHDLDAWQNYWFDEPEFDFVGICKYSTSTLNGGSVFWNHKAKHIVKAVLDEIEKGEKREEPTLNKILKSKKVRKHVTILNETFNVGCSGFIPRFSRATKPVLVSHVNPYNRIAWETHRLDRNGVGFVSISSRLEVILRKYFPHLATELSPEGKIRSQLNRLQYHSLTK